MMSAQKKRTKSSVHIVMADTLFIIPVKRDNRGAWIEVIPVIKMANINDPYALAEAIGGSHQVSESDTDLLTWNGEQGLVWATASHFWVIQWFEDGSALITPYQRIVTTDSTADSKDDEWRGMPSHTINFSPMEADETRLAEMIIKIIEEND